MRAEHRKGIGVSGVLERSSDAAIETPGRGEASVRHARLRVCPEGRVVQAPTGRQVGPQTRTAGWLPHR